MDLDKENAVLDAIERLVPPPDQLVFWRLAREDHRFADALLRLAETTQRASDELREKLDGEGKAEAINGGTF